MILLNKLGIGTAILSFLIGTFLMLTYFFANSGNLIFYGYFFVLGAFFLNLIIVLLLLRPSQTKHQNRRTVKLMLLNIPIAFIYFCFVMVLLSNMRVIFINKSGKKIENIRIYGCESEKINRLDINESQTVWIGIPGDCSVHIEYKIDGKIEKERVFGYVTNFMGQRTTFRIGIQEQPIF